MSKVSNGNVQPQASSWFYEKLDLSQSEAQEVEKYLIEGLPLPDKYRFKLFKDRNDVELVWNGKTQYVTNVSLPFQTIEVVDEPREEVTAPEDGLFQLDNAGRQLGGWKNKLIWGDNKLILSSILNGSMRKEIEASGGIKLIYIDPPFDVGDDFTIEVEVGDEDSKESKKPKASKKPSVIEEIAYRDTWGRGNNSYLAMMYERLKLMKDLLADDGSIYLHCDWRVSSMLRMLLDEVFGKENFRNEIIWYYETYQGAVKNFYPRKHDTVFFYTKSTNYNFKLQYTGSPEDSINFKRWEKYIVDGNKIKGSNYPKTDSRFTIRLDKWVRDNKRQPKSDDVIFEVQTVAANSVWKDVKPVDPKDLSNKIAYPTQKPEKLLERIIKASSNKGDIVCDFFAGSGSTGAVAEKLGRKWIMSDLGKFSVHTTRKRMLKVQRELKQAGQSYRAFEIMNLGKYERQFYVYGGRDNSFEGDERERQLIDTQRQFMDLILEAYKCQPLEGFTYLHGFRGDKFVSVGEYDAVLGYNYCQAVIKECREKKIRKVDILAFEFEQALPPSIQQEAKDEGVTLGLKYIPREVFDKRAVEKNQVMFYDVAFIEAIPRYNDDNSVVIELVNYSVFYNQNSIDTLTESMKNGSAKVDIINGQVIRVNKDKSGVVKEEVLTKVWSDWVDYWSIDWNYESQKMFERIPVVDYTKGKQSELLNQEGESSETEYKEVWNGRYIFENDWQSFRTKKDRSLELKSVPHYYKQKGRYKVAVKVVDIFGNDTTKIVEINII